nr:MAG TPA: hypothetical protein [Caudoviricetes sp.]
MLAWKKQGWQIYRNRSRACNAEIKRKKHMLGSTGVLWAGDQR